MSIRHIRAKACMRVGWLDIRKGRRIRQMEFRRRPRGRRVSHRVARRDGVGRRVEGRRGHGAHAKAGVRYALGVQGRRGRDERRGSGAVC